MTAARIFPNASFTYFRRSLWLPFTSGVVGMYVLGGDQASSLKNRANPSAPMTVIGAPTYNEFSATIETGGGGGAYTNKGFNTGLSINTDATIYVVRKNPSVGAVTLIGDLTPPFGLSDDGSILGAWNGQNANPPAAAALTRPATDDFYFALGKFPRGGSPTVKTYAAGVPTSNTGGGTGSSGAGTLKMGSSNGFGGAGRGEVAFVAVINRLTTVAEDLAAYEALVAAYTDKITIA
jgi:hypothetical protein